MRWAAACAIGSLALFAVVSVGQMTPAGGLGVWHPTKLGAEDGLASAEAQRRNAAAIEAESTQTSRNARDALETADATLAEAEAEAERLTKTASQKRKDFEIAKADTDYDAEEGTSLAFPKSKPCLPIGRTYIVCLYIAQYSTDTFRSQKQPLPAYRSWRTTPLTRMLIWHRKPRRTKPRGRRTPTVPRASLR